MKAGMLALLCASLALPQAAAAQQRSDCELHVWTTNAYAAVYHGAEVGPGPGEGGYSVTTYLARMEPIRKRLADAIDETVQADAIRAMTLGTQGRFAGYRLIFHTAPAQAKYSNWTDKNVGAGGRDTDSTSSCYAELHTVFIALFRTAISKKIQTGFLFRDFGANPTVTFGIADASSTGAAAFKTNDEEKSDAARSDLRAAFQENLRIFLRKKKMMPRR